MVALQLNPNAGDPGAVADGDLWYNSSTAKFRGRQGGVSIDLSGGAAAAEPGQCVPLRPKQVAVAVRAAEPPFGRKLQHHVLSEIERAPSVIAITDHHR